MTHAIELDVSLLGAARAFDRLAAALTAAGDSLRASEVAETPPVHLPASPKPVAVDEPDPAQIFGAAAQTVEIPPPPAADLPPPPAPGAALELDAKGHAWDERIHASSRAKIADGTWRQKRGVNAGLLAQVEAARASGTPTPAAPVQAPPIPPPPAVATPAVGAMTFGQVVGKVQAAITAGTVMQADVDANAKLLGLPAFPALSKRPDLFEAFLAALGA